MHAIVFSQYFLDLAHGFVEHVAADEFMMNDESSDEIEFTSPDCSITIDSDVIKEVGDLLCLPNEIRHEVFGEYV